MRKAMSREQIDEAVREGKYEVVGMISLNPGEVASMMREFEGHSYLTGTDFFALYSKAVAAIQKKVLTLDSEYLDGIKFDAAKALILAMLKVHAPQRPLSGSDDKEQTADELTKLSNLGHAASSVSVKLADLTKKLKAAPHLEDYAKLFQGIPNRAEVEATLLAARAGDPLVTLSDGRKLPPITPPPKALTSKKRHRVTLSIDCVHGSLSIADVKVVNCLDAGILDPALVGLIGQIVPMHYTDRKGKICRLLVGGQLNAENIEATIGVTRALRKADSKLDQLGLFKLSPSSDFIDKLDQQVIQLKLDFGQPD